MAADARALLDAALSYGRRGWAVLPVRGKIPLTEHGAHDATTDGNMIHAWWVAWPDAGVAIATGNVSGLAVLDVDPGGEESLRALEEKYGKIPQTAEVRTPRGGRHVYFRSEGKTVRNSVGKLGPGIDVRGEGGYVVAPPSPGYAWGALAEITCVPQWLVEATASSKLNCADHGAEKIPQGQRDSTLASLAGSMRRRGMTAPAIEAALLTENSTRCEPPLPEAEVRRIAASIGRYRPAQSPFIEAPAGELHGDSAGRESAATSMVKLARRRTKLFHFGENCFARISVGDHQETYSLRARGFRAWLGRAYFEGKKRAASGEALSSAINTLEGFARFQSEEREVFVRVAEHDGRIYLDLANGRWQVVEVSRKGWGIIESKECPVRFLRPHGMLPLPAPEGGGKISDLCPFFNIVRDSDFLLVVGHLLAALHPQGPYPILILHGEQGSAKTTMARVYRDLVDPNIAPVRSEPREPRDLMIAANNSWVVAFDNISSLPPWFSDGLCRLSTGGGFGTRTLYTDDEERIFQAKRPVVLNGIEELATRGDLLDRCVIIYLPRIPDERRRDEKSFDAAFQAARPRLLGVLLHSVSAALAGVDSVKLEKLPRMADFTAWVTAAEPALGWKRGAFLSAYRENRRQANDLPLETPVADALRRLPLPWSGTATELLTELESLADERAPHSKSWPASGRSLSNALRRLAPNLRQAAIVVDFDRDTSHVRKRMIYITPGREGNSLSEPSEASNLQIPADVGSDATRGTSSDVSNSSSDISDAVDAADDEKPGSSGGTPGEPGGAPSPGSADQGTGEVVGEI